MELFFGALLGPILAHLFIVFMTTLKYKHHDLQEHSVKFNLSYEKPWHWPLTQWFIKP